MYKYVLYELDTHDRENLDQIPNTNIRNEQSSQEHVTRGEYLVSLFSSWLFPYLRDAY